MIVRKYIVSGALLALVLWLDRKGRAATTAPAPDPDGTVTASSYVGRTVNGVTKCYRVDFMKTGGSRSVLVDDSNCAYDADPTSGLENTVDPASISTAGVNLD